MQGLVLIGHGAFAEGMLSALEMFFGPLPQVRAVGLFGDKGPDPFRQELEEAVREVDAGDGVLILADLLGGTPCNQAAYVHAPAVRILAGVNLAAAIDLVSRRMDGQVDLAAVLETGRGAMADYSAMLDAAGG